MKVCLDARVSPEYLKQADEIKVQQRDTGIIMDLIEKYPKATIVVQFPAHEEELNWKDIKDWYILSRHQLILCLGNIDDIKQAVELNIPCFYGYTIETYATLRAFMRLGVSYVRLGAPLTFELDKVMSVLGEDGPKIRGIANVAFMDRLPHGDGISGFWIRPEDLDKYDKYFYSIEFDGVAVNKEEALFRIYIKDKTWPGPLSMLIEGLNVPAANRMIDSKITEKRLNCGQRCESGGHCHNCYTEMTMSDPSMYNSEALESLMKQLGK